MVDNDEKFRLLGRLKDWFADDDAAVPAEQVSYVRAWLLFRKINVRQLWPVIFSVPVLVFFALSGVLAWLVVFVRFLVSLWNLLS